MDADALEPEAVDPADPGLVAGLCGVLGGVAAVEVDAEVEGRADVDVPDVPAPPVLEGVTGVGVLGFDD